jgi:hypothetical protein
MSVFDFLNLSKKQRERDALRLQKQREEEAKRKQQASTRKTDDDVFGHDFSYPINPWIVDASGQDSSPSSSDSSSSDCSTDSSDSGGCDSGGGDGD